MNGMTVGWAILGAILALLLGFSIYNGVESKRRTQ